MERFFKKKLPLKRKLPSNEQQSNSQEQEQQIELNLNEKLPLKRKLPSDEQQSSSQEQEQKIEVNLDEKLPLKRKLPSDEQQSSSQELEQQIEVNLDELPLDPGRRIKMSAYLPNDRDKIRKVYLQRGPFQPRKHTFPQRKMGNGLRRFCPSWYIEFGNWLEYSIEKDAAFCFCCYLFKSDFGKHVGGDSFVTEGFSNWKKKERLSSHVGGPNSAHNIAWKKCLDFMKQNQMVLSNKQSEQAFDLHPSRLAATIDCIRFMLKQGLALCDIESTGSTDQGNFLELLKDLFKCENSRSLVTLENTSENYQLITPAIQKYILNAAALETTNAIISDLGDGLFGIFVDEVCDISNKWQMVVALRYVNKKGSTVEHFLGIVNVKDITALSFKKQIDDLFCKHGLSISRIRGYGYDGASNLQEEFSGLKSLILEENPYAFYVHSFAHQLQLTLVAIAKNHLQVCSFFKSVSTLLNVVGGPCKQHDVLSEKQIVDVRKALEIGEIPSGQGLYQETILKRAMDTRLSSHHATLVNLITMYSAITDVLEIMKENGLNVDQRAEANGLLLLFEEFDFAFTLHLMKNVLAISNELSQALQRKDQNIDDAMNLVNVTKQQLQAMRSNGWESLLQEVILFCNKHVINVPHMEDIFSSKGKSRREDKAQAITIEHHYHVELFYTVVDMQLHELNDRFTEANTQLLLSMAGLSPINKFSAFDKTRVMEFARFYPHEFSPMDLTTLDNQLEAYIIDVRSDAEFASLKEINDLSEKLVETRKHIVYPLVYLLLKLAMILPVATPTIERACSAMKFVKNMLHNRIANEWMNDCLVTYIEKDVLNTIDNELIIQRCHNMKSRNEQL
ncbi:uncharacterized protein LOC131651908 [Vicia villosa]|uniref:uncharacterized protein LOC131651908 n=1 Tax=Vicia villosa TaxID=3911 RepID=UPI00273B0B71|nr:uncharacterized protein LOC131651908 [Vicia villosa]XP_058777615.1 uncharacterized protein LOC131651908 [Vicia villosa]XP_058777616.1 uncharacterized protein LOC131651908 [Vicia villosa]